MVLVKTCVILAVSKHIETKLFLDIIPISRGMFAPERLKDMADSAGSDRNHPLKATSQSCPAKIFLFRGEILSQNFSISLAPKISIW